MGRCRQHIGAVSSWMMGGGRAYRNMVHASLRRRFVDTREEEEMPVEDLDSASDTESEAEVAACRAPSQASREEGDKVAADDGSTISGASDGGRPHLPPVPGKRHLTTPCTCVCAAKRGDAPTLTTPQLPPQSAPTLSSTPAGPQVLTTENAALYARNRQTFAVRNEVSEPTTRTPRSSTHRPLPLNPGGWHMGYCAP